ncbi:hypothetical protein SAY86_012163 [Trapa natans]|uniref:Transcription factor ABORTED MICROSPORES n=1 Tax=Trapa natans TaxID=22666 RepID=A0AAN7LXJ9_TRANT|nr:hypothetical protein SAY86_012163 [Trapa natans]
MISIQNLMVRLRPLVGSRGWDYCVVWKLSEDQRSITWVGCCCGGADQYSLDATGEEFNFHASQALSQCKDVMVPHTRSSPCELLSHLPSSLPLDSGIYTHSLLSNQSRWLNFASSLDSDIREETVGTKVLIPVSGGVIIELFVTKQVPEDPQTLDFVTAQCSLLMEADMLPNSMDNSYNADTVNSRSVFINVNNDQNDNFIQAHAEAQETPRNLQYNIPVDPIRPTLENKGTGRADDMYSETSMLNMESMNIEFDIISNGLHWIQQLDRASILGDAIEFIKDLQKQAKELQDELEEHSDIEDGRHVGSSSNNIQSHGSGTNLVPITNPEKAMAGCETSRQNHRDSDHTNFEKPQQMEPQVEVAQVDSSEFFVKVFGEHRPGGFVRLMEALDALGLEVTNVNMTSFRSLVSNVFTVEKKDSDLVQADHVKDSLIELTRNPSANWQGMMTKVPENNAVAASSGDPLPQLHQHHIYSNILHAHHHFLSSPPPSSPF